MRQFVLLVALTLVGTMSARPSALDAVERGQAPTPAREPLIVIDLRALSGEGAPVLDLTPDDLTLKVNGHPREIRLLDLHRFAGDGAETAPPPASLPAPFASNQFSTVGRDVYLVFEDESIAPGNDQAPREAALHLVASLEPRDRVAVLTVPLGGIDTGLTTDRGLVRTALSKRLGRAAQVENVQASGCRTRNTLAALTATLDSVRGGPGTTLVFFSSALTPPSGDNVRLGSANELCPVLPEDFKEVGRAARDARAAFYAVHLFDGAVIGTGNGGAGLESLAGVTDGELIRLSRNNTKALDRVSRETGASYVLGFPLADARPGANLHLELKTARPGVRLRSPSEFGVATGRGRPAPRTKPSVRDMLRASTIYRDLPLRALTCSSRNAGDDQVKLVTVFEAIDPAVSLKSAMVGVFDDKGRLLAQSTARVEELASSPAMLAVPVPPGHYRVRVVATDASGLPGSVDVESRVGLTRAGPIRLSTLVLGSSSTGAFTPRLEFTDTQAVTAYLEVYQVSVGNRVSVDLELAAEQDGPVLATATGTVRQASVADLRLVSGTLSIGSLPPGDYQVRATVHVDGQKAGQAAGTLRKTGR